MVRPLNANLLVALASLVGLLHGAAPALAKEGALAAAVSPDGTRLYVTESTGYVAVVDTAANRVIGRVTIEGSGWHNMTGATVSPDGSRLYVTLPDLTQPMSRAGALLVIDPASGQVIGRVPLGVDPGAIAQSPDGSRLYVTNLAGGTVSVIDPARATVVTTLPVGKQPLGLAVSPDGAWVFVADDGSSAVSVIDAGSNRVVATVPVPQFPERVAVSPDGARLYVSHFHDQVTVIDTARREVLVTLRLPAVDLGDLVMSHDGRHLYLLRSNPAAVLTLDPGTGQLVATLGVKTPNHWAMGMAASPDGTRLYVTGALSDTLWSIDPTTDQMMGTIDVSNGSPEGH
jgi:YVTN family beta-propeller protein